MGIQIINTWSSMPTSQYIFTLLLKRKALIPVSSLHELSNCLKGIIYPSWKTTKKAMLDNLPNFLLLVRSWTKYSEKFQQHLSLKKNRAVLYTLQLKNPKLIVSTYRIGTFKKLFRFPKIGKKKKSGGKWVHLENWKHSNIESSESWEKS